ncbi:DUF58 domain-containing protein [Haloarcula sp. JP-L23]|uniref:DUF58 domain-containing protein n=1 Tax=Haloarcula sp. JP-L23 TaxID=2716717 RepID=UPI00140EF110|nr:DUF58 domain-containing protein [Haloarcula sp. JP-L23]
MTDPTAERTNRYRHLVGAILVPVVLGVALQSPVVYATGAVPIVYVLYGELTTPDPATDRLSAERTLDPETPAPGESVTVTLSVTNTGADAVTDLRVVDGVPGELGVTEGSPRKSLSLGAGETGTVAYDVIAKRGTHDFGDLTVASVGLSGEYDSRGTVPVETTLRCEVPVEDVPLTSQTARRAGQIPTDIAGEGISFHSTREYRTSDPARRIDWRRYARTNELSTVEYQEEHAATVVLLVDRSAAADTRTEADRPTGSELSLYAAERTFYELLAGGNRVGVGLYPDRVRTLDPGVGADHAATGRELFADAETVADRSSVSPERDLLAWLPASAQVVLVSPLLDDEMVALAKRLAAHRHDVSVVSPRLAATTTVGKAVSTAERAQRIRVLEESGAPVVDWDPDEPLRLTLESFVRRWL